MEFLKGHGTGNDFIVLPDPAGSLVLNSEQIQRLCDRRFGIGADGVLRVVRTKTQAEVSDQADEAEWFMDYHNADGSVAEMCGNGARVFAHYLQVTGLEEGRDFAIATRGGTRRANVLTVADDEGDAGENTEDPAADATSAGDVTVSMGRPSDTLAANEAHLAVVVAGRTWPAAKVHFPNPHAVVAVLALSEVGPLIDAPELEPASAMPEGANVEFVEVVAPGHVRMRVHERGVGETQSCGTGACAVAWVHSQTTSADLTQGVRVDVPGGTVFVNEDSDGEIWLRGPAQIVARGTVDPAWWSRGRHV